MISKVTSTILFAIVSVGAFASSELTQKFATTFASQGSAYGACQDAEGLVLKPGEDLAEDVLGKHPFKIIIPYTQARPGVKLVEEFAGFECQLQVEEVFDPRSNSSCLVLNVSWQPGADYSGCILEVGFPVRETYSHLELYMYY